MELTDCLYGVSKTFDLPLIEYGATDYKTGVTLVAGDVKVKKDNGSFVNIATLPTVNGAWMEITLSATEMEAERISVQIIDQTATKVFEDTGAILTTEIINKVWDEPLTGATHNVPTSSGKRLRQSTGIVFDDGIAQAGGANNITLAAASDANDGIFWQAYIMIVDGTGAGQGHHIVAYNGTTKVATIDDDWIIEPDATSEYIIYGSGSHEAIEEGTPTAVASNTITLNTYSPSIDGQLNELLISIISGTGNRQVRRIIDYDGTTKVATIDRDWDVNPTTSSGYWIIPTRNLNDIKGADFIEATDTLAEIQAAVLTRLASTPFATEHSPASYTVTDGTELTGVLGDIQTINQTYLKVQETGKYKIDTTYIDVDEEHDRFFVRYRYFGPGSSNHKVEMKMWNYQTSAWDNVLVTDKDLPATDLDLTIVFDVPGTVSDYYTGSAPNLSAQLRIEHKSNFNTGHQFWLDAIGLGDLEQIYTEPDNVGIAAINEVVAKELLVSTTIATLASQTSFTLAEASTDDDAYNNALVVITDAATAEQKAVGLVLDYTGATKTLTLSFDPAIFTMAVGDTVDIIAHQLTQLLTVISPDTGGLNLPYGTEGLPERIVKGDCITFYRTLTSDWTDKRLFFAMKLEDSEAFVLGDNKAGANEIELTGHTYNSVTDLTTVPVSLTTTQSNVAVDTYKAEIEARETDGSCPTTPLKFDLEVIIGLIN